MTGLVSKQWNIKKKIKHIISFYNIFKKTFEIYYYIKKNIFFIKYKNMT